MNIYIYIYIYILCGLSLLLILFSVPRGFSLACGHLSGHPFSYWGRHRPEIRLRSEANVSSETPVFPFTQTQHAEFNLRNVFINLVTLRGSHIYQFLAWVSSATFLG